MHIHSPYRGLLSNKNVQRIYYMIKLINLDNQGNQVSSHNSGIKFADFSRNEEKMVFMIESNVKYPILLNLKILTCPLNLHNSLLLDN